MERREGGEEEGEGRYRVWEKMGGGIGEVLGSRGFEGGATKRKCGHTNY